MRRAQIILGGASPTQPSSVFRNEFIQALHDEGDVASAVPCKVGTLFSPTVVERSGALPRTVDATVMRRFVAPRFEGVRDAGRTFKRRVRPPVVPMLDDGAERRKVVALQLKPERGVASARDIKAGDIHFHHRKYIANDRPAVLFDSGAEAH